MFLFYELSQWSSHAKSVTKVSPLKGKQIDANEKMLKLFISAIFFSAANNT
jgi:hypothetical protein